jgi:hypothetical protein
MSAAHGPGITWLAARTGKDPSELLSSPVAALADAVRELALLATRAESDDPEVRAATEPELATLRGEIAAAPPPSEAFLSTVAGVLRDTAERLKFEDG